MEPAIPQSESSDELFVEQAEHIAPQHFTSWTVSHPRESEILRKLCGGGAKLLVGPRGCGKTTLLLKAQEHLAKSATTIAVYVNFKSSLRLEPIYRSRANAMYWFNQWMALKCLEGMYAASENLSERTNSLLSLTRAGVLRHIDLLERGAVDQAAEEIDYGIDKLRADINSVLAAGSHTRCVILLDDAAHAFSSEQQRDFFDFFRRLKSREIAPKAAIYPGVTIYSPGFHVGHDAEEVDAWINPYESDYQSFMRELLRKRLPSDVYNALEDEAELTNLLILSCFGIPRGLLNSVRGLYSEGESESGNDAITASVTYSKVMKEIRDSFSDTLALFRSLKEKLPMYENYVDAGEKCVVSAISIIREYNRSKKVGRVSVSFAINDDLGSGSKRVLGFLQYSGLIRHEKTVSRGEKGRFLIYTVHIAGLIARNALIIARRTSTSMLVRAIEQRNAHEFTRVGKEKLIDEGNLTLALPACTVCKTPRASETAKFCLECGNPLNPMSVFKELVSKDIRHLPITETRAKRIIEHSNIRTIGDVLADQENRGLRSVPWIGPVWAQRIFSYAEEYVS